MLKILSILNLKKKKRGPEAGTEPELKVRGVVLLLVACSDSSFRLSCLTANEVFFFFFFFVFFMCASRCGQNYFV